MSAPADLAEFRLLRALRAGQPGAFPTLWNAQAGATWSVVRALAADDREALGWMASFRLDLAEQASSLDAREPVAAQVGKVLFRHLSTQFSVRTPLPQGPLTPTEAGVRAIPAGARLLYLVDLFFDAHAEDAGGREDREVVNHVRRLLEPSADTDARLLVYASLLRNPPADALILPPGEEAPPQKPRWWTWIVGGGIFLLASGAMLWGWFSLDDWADVGALHEAAQRDPTIREGDPVRLGIELARRDVPSALAEAPDLSALDLTLLGAWLRGGVRPVVALVYSGQGAMWTLQHHQSLSTADGPLRGTRDTPYGLLEARASGSVVVVSWSEASSTWALASDAPPDRVLDVAAQVREMRGPSGIPFLGGAGTSHPGQGSD